MSDDIDPIITARAKVAEYLRDRRGDAPWREVQDLPIKDLFELAALIDMEKPRA